jgi:hypothetical protein
MASGAQQSHIPTITVLHPECRGGMSLRHLARDINADPSNVRKAKNWLIENKHPAFEEYAPDDLLNAEQVEAITTYRSYTTAGIRGDALTAKMFPNEDSANARKDVLRKLFEQHNIPPAQAAKLTYLILRIFQP